MLSGIDVASSQRNLDFGLAYRAGYRVCYVKLGGDNSGRYVAPYYAAEVDKARAAGFRVGHYWVPGATDPVAAADYAADRVRGWTSGDFFVLDNETLDTGRLYEPAQAAQFLARIRTRLNTRPFIYVGASELRARDWAPVEALGARLIVASYGANNGTYPGAPNLGGRFGNVWAGHQYTDRGNIGGVAIDLNVFQDWAFDNVSVAGGGITIIMSLSSEKYQGENAKNVPGGASIFNFVDWTLTAVKNLATRNDAIHKAQDTKLDAISAAIKAGVPVTVKVDEAFADLVASKVAAKIPAAATSDAVREIVQSELATLVLAPRA